MEKELLEFIQAFENKVVELSRDLGLSSFDASISGKSNEFKETAEIELKLKKVYSNKDDFEKIKIFKNSKEIKNEVLLRELEILYNSFAEYQIDDTLLKKTVDLSSKIEQTYSTFRTEVNNNKLTDNEIDEILETSKDSLELEETWKASKQIGKQVSADVIELVKLRNKAAKNLGYENYHQMSLILSELDPDYMDKLFDDLDELLRPKFETLKNEIDDYLSTYYNVKKNDLMPWHYQ
ncbi:MAG: M2 family metallopeptidase, partial [Ignavibacteriae bacterium]|nr:M2 family metallopeptidase [Ignavibacteriota bacterium]